MEALHTDHIGNVADLLTRAGYSMATAESCTGGMIGALCTEVPGSSAWFKGGIIAYDNVVKEKVLGVPTAVLEKHGAVSAEVVQHMAAGALFVCRAQAAVAVSGVAGPDGGTPEKPVGTVWLAVAVEERPGVCAFDLEDVRHDYPNSLRIVTDDRTFVVYAVLHQFDGDRQAVREQAAREVLRELADFLARNRA